MAKYIEGIAIVGGVVVGLVMLIGLAVIDIALLQMKEFVR